MNHQAAAEGRLGLRWPGHIAATSGQEVICEIFEVGLEDALVRLDPCNREYLSNNTLASLHFYSPCAPDGNRCETPVQVVLLDNGRAHLTFELPEQEGVRALNSWAFEQHSRQGSSPTRFDPRRTQEVFDKCLQASLRFFEDRLPQVPDTAKETLFERAHNASSNTQQAESFDAMQEVERVIPSVIHGFLEEFNYCIGRLWAADTSHSSGKEDHLPEELSLIDTGSFNDWLLTVQIIERAKRRGVGPQNDLSLRLSQLLKRELEETPFGLEGVCSNFHDSMQNLGAGRATRQALLIAFEIEIIKQLETLHWQLSSLLESAGVPPLQKSAMVVPTHVNPSSQMQSVPSEHLEESTPSPHEAQTGGDLSADSGDGFRTAQTLIHLRREPEFTPGATSSVEYALPHAVLEALAGMDEGEGDPDSSIGKPSLTRRVKEHLSSLDVQPDDATNDVLDLVSDLVESMLSDPLVHPEVSSAISRLALSLSRSAVAGDAFFAEVSHPARQLLDGLALVRAAGSNAASWDRINAALVPVVQVTLPTRREYTKALSVISPIAERRETQLRQTIHDAIDQFNGQQAALESMKGDGSDKEEALRTPLALKVWLGRVDNLRQGDVVLFENSEGPNRPATLAWKAPDDMTLAFVQHDDYKVVSFTRQAVAMEMRGGQMRKIEGGTLGLTERALCRQLYSLHRQVHAKAANDPLTGLVTRKHFEEKIRASVGAASDSFDPDHLCLVQLDDFTSIHARCGRCITKQLLRKLANMLRRQVDEAGLVCRIKGHRFGILIQSGDHEDVVTLMQRYRRSVEEARCVFKGKPFPITVSAGLMAVEPSTEVDSVSQLMATVESTLAKASSAGGNRLEVKETSALAQISAEAEEPSVTELIREERLALRAQRVEPLTEGLLPYYEILLGIREPDGNLPPLDE